jgi:hypothetical protein
MENLKNAHQMFSKMFKEQDKAVMVKYMAYFIIVILIISLIAYTVDKMRLNKNNSIALSKIYPSFPNISSINPDDATYDYNLRDYYIKTAYNCCCGGEFKNDYVSTDALKKCISQGARVLDFDIYSINDEPIIAASSIDNYRVKQTYNQIPLHEGLEIINNYAFSGGSCPNPNDPLILHFRISSNNDKMYKKMADTIYTTIQSRLLDKEYSYEYAGKNLGSQKLKLFMGKIIISVDRANPMFENTPLKEYVNIASSSIFLRALRHYDIVNTPNSDELIEFNKKNMTIAMPDLSVYNNNISPVLNFNYGCQWVGMNFQNFDDNMQYYTIYFDKVGHAFVLKPENLRFVPVTIPDPTPQDPANSFTSRDVSTDYYSFSV